MVGAFEVTGATQVRISDPGLDVAAGAAGAEGTLETITGPVTEDAPPTPTALIADTRKKRVEPRVKVPTFAVVAEETESLKIVQEPLAVLAYSIR